MVGELRVQSRRSFTRSCQHDHTRNERVEAADDAHVSAMRLVVFFLQIQRCEAVQSRTVTVAHRGQTRGFVDDEQMIVFVEYLELHFFTT